MISYTPHCDDCAFGILHYQCPVCGEDIDDDSGAAIGWLAALELCDTECPQCHASLILDPVMAEVAKNEIYT